MKHMFALVFCFLIFASQSCNAVIGGSNATSGEFPFIVSLRNETNLHYCGGTLITKKHVVTAAHCIYTDESMMHGKTKEKLPLESVKVQTDSIIGFWDPDKSYQVEKMTDHPSYDVTNFGTLNYDIAIITLKVEVSNPALVPPQIYRDGTDGKKAVALGWGVSRAIDIPTFTTSRWLQKLEIDIVNSTSCESAFRSKGEVYSSILKNSLTTSSIVCGFKGENAGVCYRDSGSPVLIDGKLLGHATFTFNCLGGAPDLYTPIVKYADFVNEQVGQKIV